MSGTSSWGEGDIPDQSGRTVIVTGANTGIGFETARMLARRGARVVLACRSASRGAEAVSRIEADLRSRAGGEGGGGDGGRGGGGGGGGGSATLAALDLADLDSVRAFAAGFAREHDRLDLLVNNAGVMVPPLSRTRQGFELQLGVNHLGHVALTGLLLPRLEATPDTPSGQGPRVVVLASTAQRAGRIDFDDLSWESRAYRPWAAYGQSKLANMMFALELHRRLSAAGSRVRVTAAHPGFTNTELQRTSAMSRIAGAVVAMKAADGALPTLRAATDPDAESGSYWGPSRLFEIVGPPARATIPPGARDAAVAARLFDESARLVGVAFP